MVSQTVRRKPRKPRPPQKREYSSWLSAFHRCYTPSNPSFRNYGGRGIEMSPEWKDDFAQFFADMGERPPGYTLGRICNDGNYSAENCRWETWRQQANNKRDNHRVTINGVTDTLANWVRVYGADRPRVAARLREGWTPERALTEPSAHPPITITFDGHTRNLREWSAITKITTNQLYLRVRRGWPPERILRTPPKPWLVTWNGQTLTLEAWSKQTGIKYRTLYNRMCKGWNIKDVLSAPVRGHLITFDGRTQSVSEWSRELRIPIETLDGRLFRGWSIARTLTTPLLKR